MVLNMTSTQHHPFLVETTSGLVLGHAETGTVAFRGIPYAQPPIGQLRFRQAQPVEPWSGVLKANANGPQTPQFRNKKVGYAGQEDALWLNVVIPRGRATNVGHEGINPQARRPIVIFIHGGSNIHGSAADPLYSGEHFAAATDSIVVTVNYRLGMFGQLNLSAGSPSTALPEPSQFDANAGLSDLVTAIEWVHANAESFGGDPDRVTIMGESSGGAMVAALCAVPRVRPLLAGAIAQSPAAAMIHTEETVQPWIEQATRLLRKIDPRGERATFHDASQRTLVDLTEALTSHSLNHVPGIAGPFAPFIDGDLLPQHPLAPGAQTGLPLLAGVNQHEYQMMRWEPRTTRTQQQRLRAFAGTFGGGAAKKVLADLYADGSSRRKGGLYFGDALFVGPTHQLLRNHPTGEAWTYRLDMLTPSLKASGIGALHALDLPILFQRYDAGKGPIALALGGRGTMQRTTEVMQQRWKNFIHHQNPGFPRYTDRYATQVFSGQLNLPEVTLYDPDSAVREAWSTVDFTVS